MGDRGGQTYKIYVGCAEIGVEGVSPPFLSHNTVSRSFNSPTTRLPLTLFLPQQPVLATSTVRPPGANSAFTNPAEPGGTVGEGAARWCLPAAWRGPVHAGAFGLLFLALCMGIRG